MTSAFWLSPLAVSGSTIPEGVASSGSTGLSSTRAPSGLNLTLQPPLHSLLDAHKVKPSLAIRQRDDRFTFSWRLRGLGSGLEAWILRGAVGSVCVIAGAGVVGHRGYT